MSSHAGALRADAAFAVESPVVVTTSVRALFLVIGHADAGLLPRLIEPIAKLGHVPSRVHASRESGDGSELSVDIRLSGVTRRAADLVERSLRAIIGVRQVIAVIEAERTG